MAKQAYVYSGTEWVPLASEVTNLSAYQTKALNQFPYRNLIINGAMQVAQRNTSVASITTGDYRTVDYSCHALPFSCHVLHHGPTHFLHSTLPIYHFLKMPNVNIPQSPGSQYLNQLPIGCILNHFIICYKCNLFMPEMSQDLLAC